MTARSLYAKYANEIMKLESKTCVYTLSSGHLTKNTVKARKWSINTIDFKKMKCNDKQTIDDKSSIYEFRWKIYYVVINLGIKIYTVNLYNYIPS